MFGRLKRNMTDFAQSDSGSTAMEYGVIAAGVAAFIAATVYGLGSNIQNVFYNKLTALMK